MVIVSLALAVALTQAFPGGHEKKGKHEHGNSTRLQGGRGGHGKGGHGGHGGQEPGEMTTAGGLPEGSTSMATEAPATVQIQKRLVLDLVTNYNKTTVNNLISEMLTSFLSSFGET